MNALQKQAHFREVTRDPRSLRHVPFIDHLGVIIESMEPGRATLSLTPRPEHLNSWGAVHGGVVMTLQDICMVVAGRSYDPVNLSGVTVDMRTSFIAPGRGKQLAIGTLIALDHAVALRGRDSRRRRQRAYGQSHRHFQVQESGAQVEASGRRRVNPKESQ